MQYGRIYCWRNAAKMRPEASQSREIHSIVRVRHAPYKHARHYE
jgi:hypothetical protein